MASDSTPITGLPETNGRMQKKDLLLTSKQVDGEYKSMKLSYSTLTSNISVDILPLVPKQEFPIYDQELPLTSKRDDKVYSTASVTKFYEQTQDKFIDINNNKLDRVKTTNQTVAGPVEFKGTTKCPTSTATSGKDIVNIDYLNNKLANTVATITEFWTNADGTQWYRIYSNGWLEQGGYATSGPVVTLKKEYKNTYYQIQITRRNPDQCGYSEHSSSVINVWAKGFQYKMPCSNHPAIYWETKGLKK